MQHKIIIIEDDKLCLESLKLTLEKEFVVVACETLHDGLNAIVGHKGMREHKPLEFGPVTFILLDLKLPDSEDVKETLQQVYDTAGDTPVMVLSNVLNVGLIALAAKYNMACIDKSTMTLKSFPLTLRAAQEAAKRMRRASLIDLNREAITTAVCPPPPPTSPDPMQWAKAAGYLVIIIAVAICFVMLVARMPEPDQLTLYVILASVACVVGVLGFFLDYLKRNLSPPKE